MPCLEIIRGSLWVPFIPPQEKWSNTTEDEIFLRKKNKMCKSFSLTCHACLWRVLATQERKSGDLSVKKGNNIFRWHKEVSWKYRKRCTVKNQRKRKGVWNRGIEWSQAHEHWSYFLQHCIITFKLLLTAVKQVFLTLAFWQMSYHYIEKADFGDPFNNLLSFLTFTTIAEFCKVF